MSEQEEKQFKENLERLGPIKRGQCPRCKEWRLHSEQALNSLSRRDGKTYICNTCVNFETAIDLGRIEPDDIEKEFVKTHKKE